MNITEKIQAIEKLLEQYEEAHDPEERMDLKQSIQFDIKSIKMIIPTLNAQLQIQVANSLADFEEILTY